MDLNSTSLTTKNVDISKLPNLMKFVVDKKKEYPDDIVLIRVGDFYEAYFEDAVVFSRLTGVTLTGKPIGKKEDKYSIPMAGVPHRTLNEYAAKLVSYNKRVVIVEQLEDPKTVKAGKLVKRGVIRVITSSTVVEDGLIDEYLNNYLCVVYKLGCTFGLCFSDISTGEVYMTSTDSIEGILNELSRYKPSELLLNNECYLLLNDLIEQRLKLRVNLTIKEDLFEVKNLHSKIENAFKLESIDKIKYIHISELYSLYVLLSYVDYTQCIEVDYGSLPISYSADNFMVFDIDTRRNLELCENIIDRKKQGTLLSVIDKTKTVMGSRLLRQWLEKPLVSKAQIEERLSAVEELVSNREVCNNITNVLEGVFDISRIMGRLKLNKSIPRDLVCIRESLKRLPYLKGELGKLSSSYFVDLHTNFNTFEDLYYLLDQAILDDPFSDIREGLVIKPGYSKELDSARDMLANSNNYLAELEERERESTGIKNLSVVNVGGVCSIEVTKANLSKVPSHYIVEKAMKSCTRYKTEESKRLEAELLSASEHSKNLEIDLYEEVKILILLKLREVYMLCDILSNLDALCSLSIASYENKYVKPKLNIEGNLVIKGGRHPVVEQLFKKEPFVSNDIEMNMSSARYLLITGPNMAGKSTYMRQIALITILSHIGCFVPADYADIPITDKIFTRIGASDDISSGRSTYMVEMEEVCNILKNASSKSLVLLDEVGRGTSTYDGLSIAQSITEYIHNVIGCKTLFATHYHELIDLEKSLAGLVNYHMSVGRSEDNNLVFLRKIQKGGLSDSYGIDVAKLAGMPDIVISRAKEILRKIEDKNVSTNIIETPDKGYSEIIDKLKSINESDINPISSYKYMRELLELVSLL